MLRVYVGGGWSEFHGGWGFMGGGRSEFHGGQGFIQDFLLRGGDRGAGRGGQQL